MKLEILETDTYSATVVEIRAVLPLENCDNIAGTTVLGNHCIVSKDTKEGDVMLYFGQNTKLDHTYISINNLYSDASLNSDPEKRGYIGKNGRVRATKLRGHISNGLLIPLSSLSYLLNAEQLSALNVGDTFDTVNDTVLCRKFVPPAFSDRTQRTDQKRLMPKVSKIVEGQFRFHINTSHLGRNMDKLYPDSHITITNKLHGTSFVCSNILCKQIVEQPLTKWQRLLNSVGIKPKVKTDTILLYDNIYSSRTVVKNDDINKTGNHWYGEDVWGSINEELKPYLEKGMTFYGEFVGFSPTGKPIQKGYDYGCEPNQGKIFIYRITYTNADGRVFEFSSKQMRTWLTENGLDRCNFPLFYEGRVDALYPDIDYTQHDWRREWFDRIRFDFNLEKDCTLCTQVQVVKNKKKVWERPPAEGVVVRVEGFGFEAYKLKAERFCVMEDKSIEEGEVDIETAESNEIASKTVE